MLSACETGLGKIHATEGVLGLRRAFLLAGARTLVLSLWKIPDEQTNALMQHFYVALLKKTSRAEALRQAQLAIKAIHPHPFYWGAFLCLGNPGPLGVPEARVLQDTAAALQSLPESDLQLSTELTFPDHYLSTSRNASGNPCKLILERSMAEGPVVHLTYRWISDLSDQEADHLDSRARAFIACAIYDAAVGANLVCQPGPQHGKRPGWIIEAEPVPVSLMSAGFKVPEKICWMKVGPILARDGIPVGSVLVAEKLAGRFQALFQEITV